ncbi:hypothetical protein C8F01DRAFT_1245561 [Mycena amicta]|nr:hypothetical protein C8F01DRAFT_1245561 [Mycena amicta]
MAGKLEALPTLSLATCLAVYAIHHDWREHPAGVILDYNDGRPANSFLTPARCGDNGSRNGWRFFAKSVSTSAMRTGMRAFGNLMKRGWTAVRGACELVNARPARLLAHIDYGLPLRPFRLQHQSNCLSSGDHARPSFSEVPQSVDGRSSSGVDVWNASADGKMHAWNHDDSEQNCQCSAGDVCADISA